MLVAVLLDNRLYFVPRSRSVLLRRPHLLASGHSTSSSLLKRSEDVDGCIGVRTGYVYLRRSATGPQYMPAKKCYGVNP